MLNEHVPANVPSIVYHDCWAPITPLQDNDEAGLSLYQKYVATGLFGSAVGQTLAIPTTSEDF